MKLTSLVLTAVVTALAAPGCMRSSTHRAQVAALTQKHAGETAAAAKREQDLTTKLAATEKQLADTTAARAELQKQVELTTTMNNAMEERLRQLGQNVESLTRERAAVAARLEEARKQRLAAEARVATFRNLIVKLRQMIDSGQLKVAIRNGRMIIALPNDILFDSGKTDVKPDGVTALARVAQVLATVSDRDFLVAGHTDNLPIKTAKYRSNWELSTARAVQVVQLLISKGMSPKVLAAAGYGEFDPVVANDTPANRAHNRRIEIVLQPNLSDLPPLDDLK